MPVRQLKIDLQSKPVASAEDQQLLIQLCGSGQHVQNANVAVFKAMMQNYMVDMLSGDPVSATQSNAIPESPSRRSSPSVTFSTISPRTILSPSFGQRVPSDFAQSAGAERSLQAKQQAQKSTAHIPSADVLRLRCSQPVQDQDELETLQQLIGKHPEGFSLHSSGKHPNAGKISALTKKGRTQFEPDEELRLINDVFFEGILGLPGFLAWTAFPIALAHYGGDFTVQFMAEQLLSYGDVITQLFGNAQNQRFIMKPKHLLQWFQDCFEGRTQAERLFNALRIPGKSVVSLQDLQRITFVLLKLHPGLSFLADTPQFQQLYAQTVSLRVLFENDTALKGYLSLADIKRSAFLDALWESQYEADINRSTRCFSYEHFYIFYVAFWELDQDRDKALSILDLERYAGGSVVRLALRRAFDLLVAIRWRQSHLYAGLCTGEEPGSAQPPSNPSPADPQQLVTALLAKNNTALFYADFVRFLLLLENPDLDASVDFWFEIADLDADGAISYGDFKPFYVQMKEKLEAHGADIAEPQDVFCQMLDYYKSAGAAAEVRNQRMLEPDQQRPPGMETAAITLQDIRQSNARGNIFSVMFHFQRFQQFDMKDPYTIRTPLAQEKTVWERFCRKKYDTQVQGIQGDGY